VSVQFVVVLVVDGGFRFASGRVTAGCFADALKFVGDGRARWLPIESRQSTMYGKDDDSSVVIFVSFSRRRNARDVPVRIII